MIIFENHKINKLKSIKNVETYCGYIMKLKKEVKKEKCNGRFLRTEVGKVYVKILFSFYEF
jgi:hypothetical protein